MPEPSPPTDTRLNDDSGDSQSLPLPPPPQTVPPRLKRGDGPRFRPLRPLGKGGLGEVHVALDEELHREIALKEVQPRHLGDAGSVARFLREAEVTGRLEHPGVVPVYSLGIHADGRPYYAMRLIKGEDLQKAIDRFHQGEPADPGERRVAFRDLLRRFVDVCNAVAYAHSRGVLHRDLKPANVMLGPYGETLVIDWGLARTLGTVEADAAESAVVPVADGEPWGRTQDGNVIGTPGFMSPEQASGRQTEVGPYSDVYSLGAILYVLLTGKQAFGTRNLMELLTEVRMGRFAPPRSVNRTVPKALEAVCLKAMALRPQDRYLTARELAADVEHWLADEPVTAYREPLSARLRRWGRRHRTAVTSLGVLLLGVTATLAVGLVLVNREKDRTAHAERQTRQALEEVTEEQARTEEALDRVTQEQGKTREALEQVRREQEKTQQALRRSREAEKSAADQRQLAVKTMRQVTEVIDAQLQGRADLQDLRKALRQRVLDGWLQVARAADKANQASHADIWAHLELADIFFFYETGGLEEAENQYRLALELARRYVAAEPNSAEARRDLSMALIGVGNVELKKLKYRAALDAYREALDLRRRLANEAPGSTQRQQELASALIQVGEVHWRNRKGDQALAVYLEALDITRRLAQADRDNLTVQYELYRSLINVGDMQLQARQAKPALDSFQEALDVARLLLQADGRNLLRRLDVAMALDRIGHVHWHQTDYPAALASYQDALDIHRRLIRDGHRTPLVEARLFGSLFNVGDVLSVQGKKDEALAVYKEGTDLVRRLARENGRNAQLQVDLMLYLHRFGAIQWRHGEEAAALKSVQEACDVARRLVREDPPIAQAQDNLPVILQALGTLQLRQGQAAEALTTFEELLDLRRQAVRGQPANAQAQRAVSLVLDQLADLRLERGDPAAALVHYKESLEIARQLAEAEPRSVEAQVDLIIGYRNLGKHAEQGADFTTADRYYEQALEVVRRFSQPDLLKDWPPFLEGRRRFCRAVVMGVDDLTTVGGDLPARRALLVAVNRVHVRRKAHDPAVAAAVLLAELADDADTLAESARAFARCVPLADDAESADFDAVRAVARLRQAVGKGFKGVRLLKNDPDFDALRRCVEFNDLLRELEEKRPK
jgi:serine/threonine-protein kinase